MKLFSVKLFTIFFRSDTGVPSLSTYKMNSSYGNQTASSDLQGAPLVLFWDFKVLVVHTIQSWASQPSSYQTKLSISVLSSCTHSFLNVLCCGCHSTWISTFHSVTEPKLLSTYCVLGTHLGCKYINEKKMKKGPCTPGTYILVWGEKWYTLNIKNKRVSVLEGNKYLRKEK